MGLGRCAKPRTSVLGELLQHCMCESLVSCALREAGFSSSQSTRGNDQRPRRAESQLSSIDNMQAWVQS